MIVIPLAFVYAYALTRSRMRFKGLFYAAAMLPLFAPSLLSAISLIYLFGNQGLLKGLLFGGSIYGPIGIIIAQVFYCFPHALIILVTALALADARLYEVADALGTTKSRIFRTVTLPGAKYGLINAALRGVHPGGHRLRHRQGDRRAVQRAGDRRLQAGGRPAELRDGRGGRHGAAGAGRARLRDRPHGAAPPGRAALGARRAARAEAEPRARHRADWSTASVIAGILVGVLGTAIWASFITYWPYNLTLTLKNYDFGNFDPGGWSPYFNSRRDGGAARR